MCDIKINEVLVAEEVYLGQPGIMVRSEDQAEAIPIAESFAKMQGKALQNVAAQVVTRKNRRHYFFPYQP